MADTRFKWNTIFVIDAVAIQKWRRFWTNRNKNNQQYFEMAFNTQYVNVYIERLLTKKRSPTNVLLSDNDCKPLKWKWDRCMTNANNCVECNKKKHYNNVHSKYKNNTNNKPANEKKRTNWTRMHANAKRMELNRDIKHQEYRAIGMERGKKRMTKTASNRKQKPRIPTWSEL